MFNRDASTQQFLDGRASSLEQQVEHPFKSQHEFDQSLKDALKKLEPVFGAEFQSIFGRPINQRDLLGHLARFSGV